MASHHFIGTGLVAEELAAAARDPDALIARISNLVAATGLSVLASNAVAFDSGGLTFVWVLAESHLVLHYWGEEGFATIDLHVCDYREPNARKARQLVERLKLLCFVAGSDRWNELQLEPPSALVSDTA